MSPQDFEPPKPGDRIIPVRIHAEHWDKLLRHGLEVDGRLQLVPQPDGLYGLREVYGSPGERGGDRGAEGGGSGGR